MIRRNAELDRQCARLVAEAEQYLRDWPAPRSHDWPTIITGILAAVVTVGWVGLLVWALVTSL